MTTKPDFRNIYACTLPAPALFKYNIIVLVCIAHRLRFVVNPHIHAHLTTTLREEGVHTNMSVIIPRVSPNTGVELGCAKRVRHCYYCCTPIVNLVIHETHWVQVVEWYHPWANLAPTLTQYMDEQDVVLVCGCGNSEMSADMYDDGEGRLAHGCCLCDCLDVFVTLLCPLHMEGLFVVVYSIRFQGCFKCCSMQISCMLYMFS